MPSAPSPSASAATNALRTASSGVMALAVRKETLTLPIGPLSTEFSSGTASVRTSRRRAARLISA